MPDAEPLRPWLATIFITTIVALAGVISYLFRLNNKRAEASEARLAIVEAALAKERQDSAVEREKWNTEREKLRTDHEQKVGELAEKLAQDLRQLYEDNRLHEDASRKEFAEIMEDVASKAGESSKALVATLDKFYDRFVGGPRSRY